MKNALPFIILALFASCKEETHTPAPEGWTQVFNFGPNIDTYAMATYGATLYLSSNDGLYRSDDNGEQWIEIANPFEDQLNGEGPGALAASTGKVFATGTQLMYSSEDFGVTWKKLDSFLPGYGTVLSMAASTVSGSGDYLFAGTQDGQVYRSVNLGATWTKVFNGGTAGNVVRNIAADGNSIFIFVEGRGFFHSVDRGTNWLEPPGNVAPFGSGALAISGTTLFKAVPQGLFKSTDGLNWIRCDSFQDDKGAVVGDIGPSITSMVQAKATVYAVAGADLYSSTDGVTFQRVPSKENVVNGAFRLLANTFFVFGLDQHRLCRFSLGK